MFSVNVADKGVSAKKRPPRQCNGLLFRFNRRYSQAGGFEKTAKGMLNRKPLTYKSPISSGGPFEPFVPEIPIRERFTGLPSIEALSGVSDPHFPQLAYFLVV